jgi:ATP-binding cassette subfamily G (WHITE) protein 2 (PDR)
MTVREALRFNSLMCQPKTTSRQDKLAYVERVIKLLGMDYYADAIVGVPGEGKATDCLEIEHLAHKLPGLNIEQRKKLTIAVELAARPKLLLFLDEPTSGLDSQTSWAILDLLEKLTEHGQAILCTIHQPSAMLFQRFDRLLLLAPDGKPVYFGNIGPSAVIVNDYFERNGATPCPLNINPADWIMEVLGCAPGHRSNIDWHSVWLKSPEYARVHHELDELELRPRPTETVSDVADITDYDEFAAPFMTQLWECFKRVNSQYWRTPSYIYSKAALSILAVRIHHLSCRRGIVLTFFSHCSLGFLFTWPTNLFRDYKTRFSVSLCSCR